MEFSLPPSLAPARNLMPRPDSARASGPVEMVAVDIDGTLLRSQRELSIRVIKSILAATRKGVRVVLASARPPRSVREIYRHLQLDTLQVNYNGALIYDPVAGRTFHHEPLTPTMTQRIIRHARRTDPRVVVSLEILDKWYTDFFDESLPTETSREFSPDFIGPLEAFWHVPVTKLMLLAPPARMTGITAAVEKKFTGKISMAVSDKHLLQIASHKVDKAHAVARIARHYGIRPERVMAIGDAPNDVGMLQWAGLGVAVANAWPAVLAVADAVVSANDKDGVAEAIQKFVLDR